MGVGGHTKEITTVEVAVSGIPFQTITIVVRVFRQEDLISAL